MELDRIEKLLDKYFDAETSIAEENELKAYFSSSDVAQHLQQYKPLFGYYKVSKEQQFDKQLPLLTRKRKVVWLSVAASVVVLLGVGTFAYFNNEMASQSSDLGTYDNPEVAFRETQKALNLLSGHVNTGVESVQYIQEYEIAKERVFKVN